LRESADLLKKVSDNIHFDLKLAHRVDWEENPRDLREFGDRNFSFFNRASYEGAGDSGESTQEEATEILCRKTVSFHQEKLKYQELARF